jgi:hypothetical protein
MSQRIHDVLPFDGIGRIVTVMRGETIIISAWIDSSYAYCSHFRVLHADIRIQSLKAYILDNYPDVDCGKLEAL